MQDVPCRLPKTTQSAKGEIMNKEMVVVQREPTVMEILSSAVLNGNVSVDVIERLARLQGEMMDRDAKRIFAESFAEFKAGVPAIVKDSAIEVKGTIRSRYAKLDQIAEKIIPALLAVKITHRWKTRTAEDGKIFVRCYLRHVLGHEEEGAELASLPDSSGSMNALQGQGSTVSYLERYTFIASCGIVVKDQDNDGNGSAGLSDAIKISVNAISDCDTLESLKEKYRKEYKAAVDANDSTAVKAFMDAYNARKKELGA